MTVTALTDPLAETLRGRAMVAGEALEIPRGRMMAGTGPVAPAGR